MEDLAPSLRLVGMRLHLLLLVAAAVLLLAVGGWLVGALRPRGGLRVRHA